MKIEIKKHAANHFILEYPALSFSGRIKQAFIKLSTLEAAKLFIETLKNNKPHIDNKEAIKVYNNVYLPFLSTIN